MCGSTVDIQSVTAEIGKEKKTKKVEETGVNKAIVDNTSSALCTPVTPFPANLTCSERGSDGMIPSAVHDVICSEPVYKLTMC